MGRKESNQQTKEASATCIQSFLHIDSLPACFFCCLALQMVWIQIRPQGYKTFFMLNSAEHEISSAHKN